MKNIEIERLILRGFIIEDVDAIYDYEKDEETVRYITWPVHEDITVTEKIVKYRLRKSYGKVWHEKRRNRNSRSIYKG